MSPNGGHAKNASSAGKIGVVQLSRNDLEQIHQYITVVNQSRTMADFLDAAMREAMVMFPATSGAWTYVNMETGFSTGQFDTPARQAIAMKHLEDWNTYAVEHPIIQHFMQPDHQPIARMSDFISVEEFKKTNLYRKWFALFDATRQIVCEVLRDGPRQFVISLQKKDADFSDHDVEMLSKLQPHLASTFRALERISELESQTSSPSVGVMLTADTSGRYDTSEEDSQRIAELFFTGNFDSILPTELRQCVVQQDHRSKAGEIDWLDKLVQCLGRECQVLVSPADKWGRYQVILNTLPQKTVSDLHALGLSHREAELLMAVVLTGATNRELAEQFSVGAETVKTHLSRAYSKLGVRSRAAAVAKVLST